MTNFYLAIGRTLRAVLLLAPAGTVLAQAPTITTVIPMANAKAAARTGPLTVTFSQPLTAASAGALKVFSSQRGGLRTRGATPAVVSGNALSFAPAAYPFMPGETVSYSVTTAAASSGGPLARARVGQFTAAVGGGTGNFILGSDVTAGNGVYCAMTVGDVDGDGDLDILVPNGNTVSVRLNNGSGQFSGTQEVAVDGSTTCVIVADIDGDGDIDLLTSHAFSSNSTVNVRFNNGNGIFSGTTSVSVGIATNIGIGDIDGDGDLDLLVANNTAVKVRLNDGSGGFSGSQDVSLPTGPLYVAVADVDNDGDLDILAPCAATVNIRLNNGNGTFSGGQDVSVNGAAELSLVVGDVDGDGDVDFLTKGIGGSVNLCLNNGAGTFSSQNMALGSSYIGALALGDIDGDGDLDILASQSTSGYYDVIVRLNNGNALFSGTQIVSIGRSIYNIVMGDADGDGDLDLFTSNSTQSNTVSVRLNGGTGLATTAGHATAALTLFPNPAHGAATLTGAAPNAVLTVLDMLGRTVLTTTAGADGAARLAVPAGLYLVRSGAQVQRLLVE